MGDLVIVYENHSKTLILQHCATIIFEAKILEFLCQKSIFNIHLNLKKIQMRLFWTISNTVGKVPLGNKKGWGKG